MRKLLLAFLLLPVLAFTQDIHITGFGGFSNYQGDLQGKPFTTDQANLAFGLGLKYDLNPKMAIRGTMTYGKLSADDKFNKPELQKRNLSFQSHLLEGALLFEYTFFDLEEKRISPYVFAGGGIYYANPTAFDTTGRKIYLHSLHTEGQGLAQYPDRKHYNKVKISIPFGGGVKFRITEGTVLGFEIGLRKLFTDYIDDVSTTYVNPIALRMAFGSRAEDMAYRGDELKDGDPVYPAEGTVRGNPKSKDWYYFSGLTLAVRIGDVNRLFGIGGNRGRIDCPKL
jgi:hypothetical protein